MLTRKDYCDYDTCVALYELGYDCHVIHLIAEKITLYEAQKWLREEWGIHITVHYIYHLDEHVFGYTLRFMGKTLRDHGILYNTTKYSTYEDTLLEGIKGAIKILKEKVND